MAVSPHNQPSKIRTFAADLEAARANRSEETEPTSTVVDDRASSSIGKKSKEQIPKAKAPAAMPTVKPVPKPATTPVPPKPTQSETDKKAVTKIPAFHELQKKTSEIEQNELEKPTHKKNQNTEGVSKVHLGSSATFITDTKTDRFKLFPSIISAIKGWFNIRSKKKQLSKAPKYVVPETSRRKGIIQKATSKSGAIFTADNEELRERIRQRQLTADKTVAVSNDEPEMTWTPYTDTGFSLLEAPDQAEEPLTQNVVVEYKAQRGVSEPDTEKTEVAEETEQPILNEETVDTIEETGTEEEAPDENALVYNKDNSEIAEEIEEDVLEETANESEEETYRQPTESFIPSSYRLVDRDTNTLTVIALMIVVGLVVLIFVSKMAFQYLGENDNPTQQIAVNETTLSNSTMVETTISNLRGKVLIDSLGQVIADAPAGLIEVIMTREDGQEVSALNLFAALDLRASLNLKQATTQIRLASVNHETPSLLLNFTDRNALYAGLLDWEENMAQDLSYLYDTDGITTETFTDEKASDIEVRVLRTTNKEVVVYGIIDDNTVLISNSLADFAQIVELGFTD